MNHNKYIPDEATLMAYLYEELKGAEHKKVEAYLEQNPEAKAELEGLQSTRGIMGLLGDQKVEQPLVLMTNSSEQSMPTTAAWHSETASSAITKPKEKLITMRFARTMIGIAAAIVLVFLMGALTNLQIKSGGNEGFAISFGADTPPSHSSQANTQKPTIIREKVDKDEVQKLLSAYLKNYGDNFTQKLGSLEQKMRIQNQQVLNAQKTKKTSGEGNGFTVTEVQMMLDNLKKDNLKTMVELIRLSNKDQRDYVGRAIADYARFMDDQRDSDLKNINRTISNLDNRTKSQQIQSDRLLARVIERVNQSQSNKKDDKNRR